MYLHILAIRIPEFGKIQSDPDALSSEHSIKIYHVPSIMLSQSCDDIWEFSVFNNAPCEPVQDVIPLLLTSIYLFLFYFFLRNT